MPRLKRPERRAKNREHLLQSAGKIFREKGFHGATVEEIANDAGFSTGVIYSQFGGKDDLFLALLERRVGWRTARAVELARNAPADSVLRVLTEESREVQEADVPWTLVAIEFRVHAARAPEINKRYAEIHTKALQALAEVVQIIAERAGVLLPYSGADMARFLAAIDNGAVLERIVEGPGSMAEIGVDSFRRLLGVPGEPES